MRRANFDAHPGSAWSLAGDGPPVRSPLLDDRRIRLLVGIHVLGGLLAGWYAVIGGRFPFVLKGLHLVPHLALNPGQACLLGTWAAFSGAPRWVRLAGLVVGAFALESLLVAGESNALTGLATLASVGASLPLLAARRRGARLLWLPRPPDPPASPGLRTTIRGLMLFTLVIALLIAGAQGMRETFGRGPSLFLVMIWSLCFVAVGLAAVWAALGLSRTLQRSLVVLALSSALGVLFSFGINEGWDSYFSMIIIMDLQAVIVLGSLLVVRSCGYRLVRRTVSLPDRANEVAPTDAEASR
jgi:hypothetical protein